MSEHFDAINDSVRAALAVSASPTFVDVPFDDRAWAELDESGFTTLALPGELGGSDGDLRDAAVACRAAALAAIPLAEANFLAVPALAAAGVAWPGGVVTAAPGPEIRLAGMGDELVLTGRVARVPWLRNADHVVLLLTGGSRPRVAVVKTTVDGFAVLPGTNVAGEPRDEAVLTGVRPLVVGDLPPEWDDSRVAQYGAAARATQIAAAASEALALATQYVSERVQFGRPLIKFQTVQHQLARLASDVVTLQSAADAAVIALRDGSPTPLLVAAAKIEASVLVSRIAAVAHQLHGAIGVTTEHRLGACTTRMWSWREEFGNELVWQHTVADLAATRGDDVWALLTGLTLDIRAEAHT
ncbi:acyl-CoA dehydrogenase family protein [Pseudarthrobacter sulfonivorans]|uniref:acyl-CoA dehydrogenase n=1 Tax=Pseudarthrobacter sulfonivorans TaxID=121292 RepID=UPI00168A8E17|nr:acyl-CoA dehydrogenase [Pseudarthrobacter sulfonivorans]